MERVVRFVVTFATQADENEQCDGEIADELLSFLLELTTAKEKAVRMRVCQIVAGILNKLPIDADISDELYYSIETRMSDRLKDKIPRVREYAARCLARLADPGEVCTDTCASEKELR